MFFFQVCKGTLKCARYAEVRKGVRNGVCKGAQRCAKGYAKVREGAQRVRKGVCKGARGCARVHKM
jgi:hypothetical protein